MSGRNQSWPGSAPLATRAKQGHWTLNQGVPLSFGAPDPVYNATTALSGTHWRSPTYDLRYNLGDVDGFGQQRQKNIEENVLLGIDFNLFISLRLQFTANYLLFAGAFKWYMMEFGNPMNPNNIQFLQARQDISSQVYSGYNDPASTGIVETTLIWLPTGPMRYWGVTIICDQVSATDSNGNAITAPPAILLTGALH